MEYIGNSEVKDIPKAEHNQNIITYGFSMDGEKFDGTIQLNVANSTGNILKKTKDGKTGLQVLMLSPLEGDDPNGGFSFGSTMADGYKVVIYSDVGPAYYGLDPTLIIIFQSKSEYIRFVTAISRKYNITDDGVREFGKGSAKPSEIIGK